MLWNQPYRGHLGAAKALFIKGPESPYCNNFLSPYREPGIPVALEDLKHGRLDDSPAALGISVPIGGPVGLEDDVGNLELDDGRRLEAIV